MLLTQDELREIDLIEERIADLERRVVGNLSSTENYSPVVESLTTTNSLTNAALVGREAASTFMRRLVELDRLLDPAAEDKTMEVSAKLEEALAMEPQLQHNLKSLNQIQEVLPALDSNAIKNVPSLTGRLEKLTLFYLDKKNEADATTCDVLDMLHQYNTIVMNVTKSFVQFEDLVTKCEVAAQPKKEVE